MPMWYPVQQVGIWFDEATRSALRYQKSWPQLARLTFNRDAHPDTHLGRLHREGINLPRTNVAGDYRCACPDHDDMRYSAISSSSFFEIAGAGVEGSYTAATKSP